MVTDILRGQRGMADWLYIQLEARWGFYFTKESSYLHLRGGFFHLLGI